MTYNPNIHHRRSIRLKGYDYSQPGLYFITICTQNHSCMFGEIKNGEMILNDAGKMVMHWYNELNNKFNDIKCRTMVVMPNHFHCIIENVGANIGTDVGANLCVRPVGDHNLGEHILGDHNLGEHIGSPLHRLVQWFKTMSTNNYIRGVKQHNWPRFDGKLWQRNYWEHIIRNDYEYQCITQYIINNPQQWENDKLHM